MNPDGEPHGQRGKLEVMNETTPPPGTSGTPGPQDGATPGADRSTSDRFFAWLRGLDITRSSDRWFTGVAGGIAAKAKIDPLIARGIFVVLALLGGPGILLYLAAWLLLPDASGRIHLEELFRGRASARTITIAVILGAILVIPAVIWVFRTLLLGPWGWSSWGFLPDWLQTTFGIVWWAVILPALIIGLIIWLSGRSNRGNGAPKTSEAPPASGPGEQGHSDQGNQYAAQAKQFADQASARASEWGEEIGSTAKVWGAQVGAQTKEWEQRSRDYYQANRLGAVHIVLTLAVALLAGGGAAAWAMTQYADNRLVMTAGILAAVAVLAVSTIIAGVRGRSSGSIGFLAFLGVMVLIFAPMSTVLPKQTEIVPFGDSLLEAHANDTDRGLVSIAGDVTIDLTRLRDGDSPRLIEVWLAAGTTTVELPENLPARITVNMAGGNVTDARSSHDQTSRGGALMHRVIEQHATGVDSSDLVDVQIRMLGGNVTVESASMRSSVSEDRENTIDELEERIAELESAR